LPVASADAPGVVDSFENVSLAKLATNPTRHEYFVEGVLARGQSCLGLGHEKVGKTGLLGMDLGLSLATGTKFLNYFAVPAKHRVLFLSGESGQTTLVIPTCAFAALAALIRLALKVSSFQPGFRGSASIRKSSVAVLPRRTPTF
jgi:hypothetical protein